MKRMYYAEYCEYGTNVSYDSMNGGAYDFYAFDSKKNRDEWIDTHEWDNYPSRTWAKSTRKAVEHCRGKEFSLVKVDEKRWICCRKGTEYEVKMELDWHDIH